MKKKFSKILGIGLTLALITSLLLMAAPVSAVTTPVVTLTDGPVAGTAGVISKANVYSVLFTTGAKVLDTEEIVVVFPAGTNITGMTETDVKIDSTAGLGGDVFDDATPFDAVVTGTYPAAQTLTITPSNTADVDIGTGAIVQLTIGLAAGVCVTNPASAGSYSLTVATQTGATPAVAIEAAVTSAAYTIKVPTIGGLPGVASVYNPVGILMAQKNSLYEAITAAGVDYTIQVGPGTYTLTATTLTIAHEGLTLVSTAGAATTIIDAGVAGTPAIHICADDVIFEGFTLDGYPHDGIWILQGADDVTVQNNIFIDGGWSGIVLQGASGDVVVTGATISGNVFDDCYTGITVLSGAKDCTISDNAITGCTDTVTAITLDGGSTLLLATQDNTITGNTITDSAGSGIWLFDQESSGGFLDDNVIEGNTISGNEGSGIVIASTALNITGLEILGNDITDNEGDGILIEAIGAWDPSNVIKFNTITGNDTSTGDYGIDSAVVTNDVDATFNWWGTAVAADIADMVSGTTTSTVDYDPFLVGTADTVFSASDAVANVTSLNAKTTVGVAVSGATGATVISVAKYMANPQAAIADALAFYDVYVVGATVNPTIKFYAGDANSEVYIWSAETESWGEITPVNYSTYGGYVYVTVDADMLDGTPFVVVAGEAADVIAAPEIATPVSGDDTVSLTPLFAWSAVTGAVGYDFQFADNANFVAPLVHLVGDNRLIVTAYAYVHELPYSTAYYWRVKAVSATAESAWVSGVFITKDEPVEPTPPVVIEETEPPVIIIEQPDIIVPLPAETPITPSWIYVIIGVGAVLVIALLVLIVRTRRVA